MTLLSIRGGLWTSQILHVVLVLVLVNRAMDLEAMLSLFRGGRETIDRCSYAFSVALMKAYCRA